MSNLLIQTLIFRTKNTIQAPGKSLQHRFIQPIVNIEIIINYSPAYAVHDDSNYKYRKDLQKDNQI